VYQQKRVVGDCDTLLESYLITEGSQWTGYKIKKLNEERKSVVADNIVTKLFNDIKAKSLNLDFSPIDVTKGDITKLKNFDALQNGINYLVKVSSTNAEIKEIADELQLALNTVIKYKSNFEAGFKMNNSLIRFVYNSIVVGLIQGTSFVVAESVEFVKDNVNLYKAKIKPSHNVAKNNHIKGIMQFNEMERKGQFIKFFKQVQQFQEDIVGDIVGGITKLGPIGKIIAIIGIIGFVLSFVRSLIFTYYNSRVRLSQYLKHLQEFVSMNASTLDTDAKRTKERQEKISAQLGKLADIISIDQNVSNDRTNSQIDESNKIIALDNKDTEEGQDTNLDLY